MKDAEYEAQLARVKPLITKWQALLVPWWKVVTNYYDEDYSGPKTTENRKSGWYTAFRCVSKWQYLDATLYVYCPQLVQIEDDDLEEMVIHEIVHILVNEMRPDQNECTEHEERTATQLARAIKRVAESRSTDAITKRDKVPSGPDLKGSSPPSIQGQSGD